MDLGSIKSSDIAHGESQAASSRMGGRLTGPRVMIRNVAFLLGGNVATWSVSLVFWLVVPRIIGPTAWGENNLGLALGGLAFAIGGLGIAPFLVKEIARDRERAGDYVGAGIATQFVLFVLCVASVFLFTLVAHYSPHTRAVVLLVTGIVACAFLVAPAVSALQALEEMHLNTLINGGKTVVATCIVIAIALIFRPDLIVLLLIFVAFNVLASLLQLGVTNRVVAIRLRFDRELSRWMIAGGLPFWGSGVFLTIYIWIDSVLLSLLVSTREVGYYAAPIQIIAIFGFLPVIVTTAVFPALSSSFRADFERLRRLTRTSLDVLISFGLPISIGAALVGPNAIEVLFGGAYRPSGPVMVVLALTVVPGYIATLAYWVLAAVDRQRSWAYVMGGMAIVNPAINLFAIPYFQSRFGHGSMGAAIALLITDTAICVAGLALIPRACLRPVGPLVAVTARVALATAAMAIPVWFLRNSFLPLTVLVGVAVYAASALALGLFRGDGYDDARAALTAQLGRRLWRRSELDIPA
jgi:O-antigen/teichoic acid export membrane protein